MKITNLVMVACIALGTSAASAQQATPQAGHSDRHPASGPAPTAVTTPAAGVAGSQSVQGGMVSEADRDFVKNAAIGGLFEVQSSQMATTMSASTEVKKFAQMMLADHTKANQELMQLAAAKQIPVPQTLDAKHAKMITKLAGKTGAEFDKAYGKAQVKAHQEAVALFQKASTDTTDPDLKAFAAKTLPVLQHHLQMTEQMPGAVDKND